MDNAYPNWKIVVDNIWQSHSVQGAGVPADRIEICDKPDDLGQDGIAWKRQWIEDELVPQGEWYVTLDDNVSGWTWLPEPWCHFRSIDFQLTEPTLEGSVDSGGKTWRQLYDTPCPFPVVVEQWQELIAKCEEAGTWFGGFAIENNYYFRGRKWQTAGYVRTSNAVVKNTGLPFYYWPGAMQEDFCRSVDVVARTGSVLVNRFLKVQKPPFEAGGIGSFAERLPNLKACSEELMRRYPGLLKHNKGQEYQLTFALRTRPSIDRWRKEHGYL
jgi:hypothetical protein